MSFAISPVAIDAVRRLCDESNRILEIGSGDGTTLLASYGYKIDSIEESPAYANGASDRVLVSPLVAGWYDHRAVEEFVAGRYYGAVIIDGPSPKGDRFGILQHTDLLKRIPIILVDDTHRPRNAELASFIGRVLQRNSAVLTDSGRTTAVLTTDFGDYNVEPAFAEFDEVPTRITVSTNDGYLVVRHNGSGWKCQMRAQFHQIHPDHILAAAILAEPGMSSIDFDGPLSDRMYETVNRYRKVKRSGRIAEHRGDAYGLAFSGGYDSVVAARLLPNPRCYTYVRGDAESRIMAREAVNLQARGFAAHTYDCGVHRRRRPAGFKSHIGMSIPAILHAAPHGLGAIAFGMVFESAFGIGGGSFRDVGPVAQTRRGELLAGSGVEVVYATASLSEAACVRLVDRLALPHIPCARSQRGPCGRCYKCFRKRAVLGRRSGAGKEVNRKLKSGHHLNVLDYAHERHGRPFWSGSRIDDLLCLERSFVPGHAIHSPETNGILTKAIAEYFEFMSDREVARMKRYNRVAPTGN